MSKSDWWKEATAYQIWPASFKDSNGDGIGDLRGITSKIDHLKELGIDLIWLSPFYDSPQKDMGYDVRDYESVWPPYGTLDDFDELVKEAQRRNIKVVVDLVINHTSNEHKWFLQSRKSRYNPYSDYYIWRDGKIGPDGSRKPPNNWRAAFGGSVWTYAEERDQYYLHLGLPEQPDLNWFNPEVRKAIYKTAITFWLDRGISGFRIDVVNFYWKDSTFPDAKITLPGEDLQPMEPQHVMNGPLVHVWLKEIRAQIEQSYGEDIVLIGEVPGTAQEEVLKYISRSSKELDMVFDFDIFLAGGGWNIPLHEYGRAELTEVKQAICKTQGLLGAHGDSDAWTTVVLENHDYGRCVSRFGPGDGDYAEAAARMFALLATTLSGTLFVYQGQEIGMTGLPYDVKKEDFRDKAILSYLEGIAQDHPNDEIWQQRGLKAAQWLGRDNGRTPVQWEPQGEYAGFSSVQPWIGVNGNYKRGINVVDQVSKPGSVLQFWKKAIKLRKAHADALIHGAFELPDPDHTTFTYFKRSRDDSSKILVMLNFSGQPARVSLPHGISHNAWDLLVTTAEDASCRNNDQLSAWEGRAYISRSEQLSQ